MNPERWQRLWALFHEALERPEGAARDLFVRERTGDDGELRAEVESLLAAHDPETAAAPLVSLPFDPDRTRLTDAAPGSRIGPYFLVRTIGEGGMGRVYEALQEEPVRRRVALKLIKLGMDTVEVVRRFDAERQVLARMDHSSIARVFDAGATPEGRPYFAMELVDGPAITVYCDRERLGIDARLELFATVCRAVHSAHQKGIIHRDLKPSNVLVATEDGRPIPKVIDFGIARAVDRRPGGRTQATALGQLVGTPETMSPEQAAMSLDLDTRTDIYSLGALLYELLGGVPAFEFRRTPFPEVLRRIREEEPAAPSSLYAAAAADAAGRAARRGSDPARLRRRLFGELDWIVARAMAKERDRRYGSAADLALDLERFLGDLPVSASPPSALYRLRKFLRRHRIEAVAATLLLVALVAFGVSMAVQSRRLAHALEIQEKERRTATQVSEFLVEILEQPDPEVARGADVSVREVLDQGAARIEKVLASQPEIQARLLGTIGRVYLNLGSYDRAEPVLRRTLELRRTAHGPEHAEVATALERLGELEFERARFDESGRLAGEALAMRRRVLAPGDPQIAESLDLEALVARQTGDLAAATALHEEALAIKRAALGEDDPSVAESYNYLGIIRRWSDDYAGAEANYRKALTIWQGALGSDHPKVAMAMNNLALALHVRGNYAESERIFEELVPLRRRLLGNSHPDLQITLANHAKLLHDMGELGRSETLYREALAMGRELMGDDHPQVATALADFSGLLAEEGRLDEALRSAEQSLAIRRRVFGEESPSAAISLGYLGEVREAMGDTDAAGRLYEQAAVIVRNAVGDQPKTAEALRRLGLFRLRTGEAAQALAPLEEAAAIVRARLPVSDRRYAAVE
ncbi:MAG: tetratricopeptide repeat protein, partial [Thermoanaerobaculia bacterium]